MVQRCHVSIFRCLVCQEAYQEDPIHHLQVGSLEDRWILTHLLKVYDGLKVPCFHFQVSSMSRSPSGRPYLPSSGWILGGQMVPQTNLDMLWMNSESPNIDMRSKIFSFC